MGSAIVRSLIVLFRVVRAQRPSTHDNNNSYTQRANDRMDFIFYLICFPMDSDFHRFPISCWSMQIEIIFLFHFLLFDSNFVQLPIAIPMWKFETFLVYWTTRLEYSKHFLGTRPHWNCFEWVRAVVRACVCLPFVGEQTNKQRKNTKEHSKVYFSDKRTERERGEERESEWMRKGLEALKWQRATSCIVSTITWNNLKNYFLILISTPISFTLSLPLTHTRSLPLMPIGNNFPNELNVKQGIRC